MDTKETVEAEVVDVTPFDNEAPSSLDTLTRAEIDMAIATAHRFPRNTRTFKDRTVAMATLDQETAELCGYALRRGGKIIKGPSVRLAEIAAACYQNIRAGVRILGETEDGKFIRAQGVCHDLENNVYISVEATRRITTRDGQRFNDDMVGVTANAAASIALRNAIFRVVPVALVKPAYEAAQKLVKGETKSLTERRDVAITKLQTLSPLITVEAILAVVEKPSVDDITPNDLELLFGLHTAIKAGNTSVEEAFPPVPKVSTKDLDAQPVTKGGDAAEEPPATESGRGGEEKALDDLKDSGSSPPKSLSKEAQSRIAKALSTAGLTFKALEGFLVPTYGTGAMSEVPADEETHILKWIKEAKS